MKHFNSLGAMAVHLLSREVAMVAALEAGLDRVLTRIQTTAKAEFGVYQDAAGPHPAWAELADSTKKDRVAQGYTENDPLLRSGESRDSVVKEQHLLEGVVASADEKLLWFELGTSKMPPRPVFGPAAYRDKGSIEKLVGAAAVAGLIGTDQIHEALGYDFTTGG